MRTFLLLALLLAVGGGLTWLFTGSVEDAGGCVFILAVFALLVWLVPVTEEPKVQ